VNVHISTYYPKWGKNDLHVVFVLGRAVVPSELEEADLVIDDEQRRIRLVETLPSKSYEKVRKRGECTKNGIYRRQQGWPEQRIS
jgi:hypothetical protein